MRRQIILDTETTGLNWADGHRVIEIGCLEMINRRFTANHFHCYLNPERAVDKGALAVHGLTNDFLKDKPYFKDIAEELLTFLSGAELIIHNASFDVGFLNYEFRQLKKNYPTLENACNILDTLMLARQKHPGQSNNLDALCRRYEIDITHRELHGALKDARLLGQVYLAMTGGQELLFAEHQIEQRKENKAIGSVKPTETNLPPLIVISSSTEEQKAHADFLNFLEKKGRCLWKEL
jgi:DNA polymerase-3 subunit epsilon